MPAQFVRYTPDIEATEPGYDKNLQIVIDKLEEYIAGWVATEGTGRAVRDAHAKGYGVVKAEVEVLGHLPAEYAQGIYAVPGKHGALIRFSNGQPHAGPDMLLGPVAGMALKIFDIDGPTVLEDEPDTGTFDYATINAPVFFCNTVEHYLFIEDLFIEAGQYFSQGRQGQHRFFRDWVTGKGTLDEDDWAWEELLAFVSLAQIRPVNLLLSNYWTMGAVRHGDYITESASLRYPSSPAGWPGTSRSGGGSGGIPPGAGSGTAPTPLQFDIQVQLCADINRMPVEDVTVEWPEQLSPFVTAAKVRIPQQDISGDDNLEKMDALSFTPWRVTAEHSPLGNIMRARKEVYRHASVLRHTLNHQQRKEPSSADEVLP